MSARLPLILLILVLSVATTSAAPFEELQLDNGLRILLLPRPGSGLVASNVFVGAGSTRELDRYAGSSHFLEHLLFNGTTTRTQEEIYAFADRIGAYNNATTRREYTHYMMVAPSEKLREALDLQSDMLLRSTLPTDKFEKERGIVVEEIVKDSDDMDYRISSAHDSLLFSEDPAFARAVLGTSATIQALPREEVWEYYRRQYVPSNMRMVLMGDFDRESALAMVDELFQLDGQTREAPLDAPALTLGEQRGSRFLSRPVDSESISLSASFGIKPTDASEHAAIALLVEILGGGENHRVKQSLMAEPAMSVESSSAGTSWLGGQVLVNMDARYSPELPSDGVLTRLNSALASLQGIGHSELEAARVRLLSAELSQLEQLHYYALFHGDRLWNMPEGYLPAYLQALEDWQLEDLVAFARRNMLRQPMRMVAVGPDLRENASSYRIVVDDRLASSLVPGPDQEIELPVRQRPPALAADEAPSVHQLENGMTVIHSASPGTRMLALHLLVKDRSGREPAEREGLVDILHRMLPQGGAQARQDLIGAQLKVADNPWIPYDDYYSTPLYSFVRMECTDEFHIEAIDYLAWMTRRSFEDEVGLEEVRSQLTGVLGRQKGSSDAAVKQRMAELLYPDHPLSHQVLPSMPVLQSAQLTELNQFGPTYLALEYFVLSVVGNLPREDALQLICDAFETRVGEGPSATQSVAPLPLTTLEQREELEIGGQQSNLQLGRVVEVDAADQWALQVAVMIASDRMQQDLRETRGLAYRLGIRLASYGDRSAITAYMGTQPANLEEAENALREVLSAGELIVSGEEIETAVNSRLGRLRMRRVSSMGQAFTLGTDAYLHGGIDHAARQAQGLREVTPGDVARVAERYLGPSPLVTVVGR